MFSIALLMLKDNFIIKGVKELSFALDKLVYSLASSAYQVFLIIGNIRLTNGGVMSKIMIRLYGVISLFMIFILAYNLLLYIIDPDKMTDNKVGGVSILKKIIIALVIIVASPTAFDTLYDACQQVLNAHVVERIVLGGYMVETEDSVDVAELNYESANRMIVDVFTAFLYPNPSDSSSYTSSDCVEDSDNDYCKAYSYAVHFGNLAPFGPLVDASKKDDTIHYSFFVSTVGGVILFMFLLGYAVNLAMRAGKLAVLEMIAPIPALMDLIPSKAGATERWIKAVLSTFAQVFIYEATIFGIVWLIGLVPDALSSAFGAIFEKSSSGPIVMLFARGIIIFGLLKVGKELPKFIGDILGIKMDGASVSGVLKNALGVGTGFASAGMLAYGTLRGGVKNLSAGISNVKSTEKRHKIGAGVLAAGSTLAGLGSGLARNIWGARNIKNLSDARKLYSQTNEAVQAKRATREAYRNLHGGHLGDGFIGHIDDMADRAINHAEYAKQKAQDEVLTQFKSMYNDGIASIWKNDSTWSYYNQLLDRVKSGEQVTIDGVNYDRAKLEGMMNTRKSELIMNSGNQEKIRDTLIQMQAFAATHQGIAGIPTMDDFESDEGFNINGTIDIDKVNGWDADGGIMKNASKELKELQENPKYVANKARDKQEAARKQAVEEARKNANKNNSNK